VIAWTDWSVGGLLLIAIALAFLAGAYCGAAIREEVWQRRMERVRRYRDGR
jgi:hypothetical protein